MSRIAWTTSLLALSPINRLFVSMASKMAAPAKISPMMTAAAASLAGLLGKT